MNERLEGKLKRLSREDFVDWAGDRTVQRGEGYLDRAVIAEAYGKANEPPELPPETVHFKVDENPFGRFAPNGGRHAKDYSFRVVTPGKTYHWDFIVSTLIYSLAKGGLDYSEHHSDGSGRGEAPGADLPMFVCSCGVAQCGGFHDQQCVFGGATVVWRIVYCGTIVEFEFDRVHYEYWALLMLWRMRGSARLRKDPWKSLVDKTGFACAVSALMETRPRCREIWERIRERRTLDETELAELSKLPADAVGVCMMKDFFPNEFSTKYKLDLRQTEATYDEKGKVMSKMRTEKMKRRGLFVYSSVVGRRWNPTKVVRGSEVAFVREPGNGYDARSIRVDDVTCGRTIGYLKRSDAHWLSDMMVRHGLVLKGHVEQLDRDGKIIPIRIDLDFRKIEDESFDWGKSLDEKSRLYFEMLRAVVLGSGEFSASMIKAEMERLVNMLYEVKDCPEIAFLLAVLTSGAKELEHRLTEEEIAKRRAYCENVRKAMDCEPAGGLLDVKGFKVLPLKALHGNVSLSRLEAQERMRRRIRLSWNPTVFGPDGGVEIPEFPDDATGFAVFNGRKLLDVCLCGIPVANLGLFDSLAVYDCEGGQSGGIADAEAFVLLKQFLDDLPVRERDKEGHSPSFWLERGIHDGEYDVDDKGRLIALRILMLQARREWVD